MSGVRVPSPLLSRSVAAGCTSSPKTAIARGAVYGEKGEYGKAIADCTEAIRADPNNADAYINRGFAYQKIGEKGKADADFAKAKELEPDK